VRSRSGLINSDFNYNCRPRGSQEKPTVDYWAASTAKKEVSAIPMHCLAAVAVDVNTLHQMRRAERRGPPNESLARQPFSSLGISGL
jgi:hypothetical protein